MNKDYNKSATTISIRSNTMSQNSPKSVAKTKQKSNFQLPILAANRILQTKSTHSFPRSDNGSLVSER